MRLDAFVAYADFVLTGAACRLGSVATIACVVAGAVSCRHQAPPSENGTAARTVSIAAASDLKFALEDELTAFRAFHSDIAVTATYGSSGNFFAQLQNHAPFDMFLSADANYPRKLEEAGLAQKGSEFVYAHGRLVVWVPATSSIDVEHLGLRAVLDPAARKVAIANPEHAPYGRAAEAALKKEGIYDAVQPKLVLGENIAQAAQFVQTGAADVGIIALSLALSGPMKDKGRYWSVPLDSYPTLEQAGVILAWAKDVAAAEEVRTFVMSPEGRSILGRYGFVVPR
jgi:molybdate transport system substrate-binding protein